MAEPEVDWRQLFINKGDWTEAEQDAINGLYAEDAI